MRSTAAPVPEDTIRGQVIGVGTRLQSGLRPLVQCFSASLRPADLVRALKLDKTLASRILRVVRGLDPLMAVHQTPSPQGLRMLLSAARRNGAPLELCQAGEASVVEFESLLRLFDGGRGDLDAALVGWLPEARQAEERRAAQIGFRSISSILGYWADSTYGATILKPSKQDPTTLDLVGIHQHRGLRRLRTEVPVTVYARRWYPHDDRELTELPIAELDEPGSCRHLLPQFSRNVPPLDYVESSNHTLLAITGSRPDINESVDFAIATLAPKNLKRYREPGIDNEWATKIVRLPCRTLIVDVFLWGDTFPDYDGSVTTRLSGLGAAWNKGSGEDLGLDIVPFETQQYSLGKGTDRLATSAIPNVPDLCEYVFDQVGWDSREFRGYRVIAEYPVLSLSVTALFPLPAAPDDL